MIPKEYFLDAAKRLAYGDSTYIPHKGCTDKAKMWVCHGEDGYVAYCNKCGEKGFVKKDLVTVREIKEIQEARSLGKKVALCLLPDDTTQDLTQFPTEARVWLYKSGITPELIKRKRIGYSKKMHRVILPFYDNDNQLLLWQGRGLTKEQSKYYTVEGVSKSDFLFSSWRNKPRCNHCVVVEDILSVYRVGEVTAACACLGTSISNKQALQLSQFDKVFVWYDNDAGGINGSTKALKKVGLLTEVHRIRTELDPKAYNKSDIEGILNESGCNTIANYEAQEQLRFLQACDTAGSAG